MREPNNPKDTINLMCSICSRGKTEDILCCSHTECPLHSYRPGSRKENAKRHKGRMKQIHEFCLDCSDHELNKLINCKPKDRLDSDHCPFYSRRLGKFPKQARTLHLPPLNIPLKDRQSPQEVERMLNEVYWEQWEEKDGLEQTNKSAKEEEKEEEE